MDELIPLSNATLAQMPDSVRVPRYDRSRLTPGIVHIGLGNFHRAHQAWYLHRLMDAGLGLDWAIVGAGVREPDSAQRDRLMAQDFLNTLIELDPAGTSAEITGAMIDFVPVQPDNAPLIAQMADPAIRIVALTVTEGGYFTRPDGSFDADHPDIQHDAANPGTPRTAFGAIVAALKLRHDAGTGPFTGQSCDNLQGNGAILRQTVISLARLTDPDLADWIDSNCSFPNSMVDCIVPATGPNELALVREAFGIADAAPVTHENFRQWVIEDDFCAGRPDWDKVGATFSNRVHDFETMKLRILNAGHQLLANAGELLSVETISGCMENAAIRGFFGRVQRDEIQQQVEPVPGMTPADYIDLVEKRFSHPKIIDPTRRVAFDGSSRHGGFLHPMIHERLASGHSIDGLALAEALWARMCEGTREDGTTIDANDPYWDELNPAAKAAKDDPMAWISQRQFYGDLSDNQAFADAFAGWLTRIYADGTEATLLSYAG